MPGVGRAKSGATNSETGYSSFPLPGETYQDADVTNSDQEQGYGEAQGHNRRSQYSTRTPTPWYVRLGRSVTGFFSSIGDKFTALWRGVSNAADAVARFFSGRGAVSDVDVAIMHIKEVTTAPRPEDLVGTPSVKAPTIYFPIPESTQNELIPEGRKGMLGAIPRELTAVDQSVVDDKNAEDIDAIKPEPVPANPGQEKFESYLAARDKAANILDYALDEDCAQHADKLFQSLFSLQSTPGYQLSTDQKAIYDAAKEIRSARSDYNKEIKEEEQKKVVEAERARQAEEAARKQPDQADFEEFVATFNRHRDENTPFMIYEGSKYLREACIQYGLANSENSSADQKSALQYLTRWSKDPKGSTQRLEQATQFISLDEVEPQASKLNEALMEPPRIDSSSPPDLDASRPPPPRPAARWISILASMKAWEPQQIKRIAGVLTLQEDQVCKAMEGLRTLARLASTSGPPAARNAGGVHTIEQVLNYDAESSRQTSDVIESLELASRLVKRLSAEQALVFDQPEKEFFNSLRNVISNVSDALDKKLKELLPVNSSATVQKKIRIPSIAELTDKQAREGGNLFDAYVRGYMQRSNNASYMLPDKSNYFKAECLAFAKAFTEEVERMQGTVTVDNNRLAASYYLLSEARRRGLIAA